MLNLPLNDRSTLSSKASVIVSITIVVAVLLIHMDRNQEGIMIARMTLRGKKHMTLVVV